MRQKDLHVGGVGNSHLNMQVGKIVDSVGPVVDFDFHVKSFGQMGDFHKGCYSSL